MKIEFEKYQGTGNDFIIIDNRNYKIPYDNTELFKSWCDRKFGIGADGIIFLQDENQYAFEMKYFNADGNESSMCGNGGRCIAHYAQKKGIVKNKSIFYAIDGEHHFEIYEDKVKLKLLVSNTIQKHVDGYLVETGSPHYVEFRTQIDAISLLKEAHAIRYNPPFKEQGINVNFAEKIEGALKMRTYERGVENETLACGTGTVAVAMAARTNFSDFKNQEEINIEAPGGNLKVYFQNDGVWLMGDATFVFKGELTLPTQV